MNNFIINNKILLILLVVIILYIIYFYLITYKNIEYFEEKKKNNICLDNFNKNLLFYSNNYYSLDKIHDKFYSMMVDDICFDEKIYKEQSKILLDIINKNNTYNISLLIHGCMGVHLSEILKNVSPKIKTVEMSNEMVKVCKNIYKNKDCEYIDKELFNYYRFNPHEFTHIMNTNNYIYYYPTDKINKYLKNINEWLVPQGYFILNIIDDYLKIKTIHGNINNNLNFFNNNYNYELEVHDDNMNNSMVLNEIITQKKDNKKRINIHKFKKHKYNKIIELAKENGFSIINVIKSKYKNNYKYLVLKKIN